MLGVRLASTVTLALLVAACGGGAASSGPSEAVPTASPAAASEPVASLPAESPSQDDALVLVAIGDSIPYNSPEDCSGCTGFVDRYAEAASKALGRPVRVQNSTKHTNLMVDTLLGDLTNSQGLKDALSNADIIIVGVAHNDVPMNRDDDKCDGKASETPDWSKFTTKCIETEVARFTPKYQGVYEQVAALRSGKPTILRTINRYNDWIGWPDHELPKAGVAATAAVIKAWNEMICAAAEANGFLCADISTKFNGADGTKPSGDLLSGDYTHPSNPGNEAIAEVLIALGYAPLGT
jgi:lysophospholipase L1-like esterase